MDFSRPWDDWRRETRGAPSGTSDLFFDTNNIFSADALLNFSRPGPQGDQGSAPLEPRFNTPVTLRASPATEHGRQPWADCTNQLRMQIQSLEAKVESHSKLIDQLQTQVRDLEKRLKDALTQQELQRSISQMHRRLEAVERDCAEGREQATHSAEAIRVFLEEMDRWKARIEAGLVKKMDEDEEIT